MRRSTKIGGYVLALVVSFSTYGQQEKEGLRNLYEDSSSILQHWRGPKNEQEYLLTGRKSGLSVGLTFNRDSVSEARIGLSAGRSLSAQSVGERTVISLFEAAGRDISVTYDLDANGTWDARISRSGKCEILSAAAWQQVTGLTGIITGTPHANMGGIEYQFVAGEWIRVKQ